MESLLNTAETNILPLMSNIVSNPAYFFCIMLDMFCGIWLLIHPFTSFSSSFVGIIMPLWRFSFGLVILLISTQYGSYFQRLFPFYLTLNGRAWTLLFLGSFCSDGTIFGKFVTSITLLTAFSFQIIYIIDRFIFTIKLPPPFGYYDFLDPSIINGDMELIFVQNSDLNKKSDLTDEHVEGVIQPKTFDIDRSALRECIGQVPTVELQLENAELEEGYKRKSKKFIKLGTEDRRYYVEVGSVDDKTLIVDHDVPFHLPFSGLCWKVFTKWPHKSGTYVGSCAFIQYLQLVNDDDEFDGLSYYLTCAHNVVDAIKNGNTFKYVEVKNISIVTKDVDGQIQMPIKEFVFHRKYLNQNKKNGLDSDYDLAILMADKHTPNIHHSASRNEDIIAHAMGIDISHVKHNSDHDVTEKGCVFGYPAEKMDQLWGMDGMLIYKSSNPEQIEYTSIDTTGGQSGSPIIQYTENRSQSYYIVGVHCWGAKYETRNGGCRITKKKFDWIQSSVPYRIKYYPDHVHV